MGPPGFVQRARHRAGQRARVVRRGPDDRQRVHRCSARAGRRGRPHAPALRARPDPAPAVRRLLQVAAEGVRRGRGAALWHARHGGVAPRLAAREHVVELERPAVRRDAQRVRVRGEQPVRVHRRQKTRVRRHRVAQRAAVRPRRFVPANRRAALAALGVPRGYGYKFPRARGLGVRPGGVRGAGRGRAVPGPRRWSDTSPAHLRDDRPGGRRRGDGGAGGPREKRKKDSGRLGKSFRLRRGVRGVRG